VAIVVDFYSYVISITSPDTEIDLQTLHDFVEDERCMASPVGMGHSPILTPEGKIEDPVNPGIYSQIILVLQSPWQIQFWGGSGYTRVYGGKLVGGLNDQPIKATGTAGDVTVLESPVDGITIVTGTSGLTSEESQDLSWVRQFLTNMQNLELQGDGSWDLVIYDDDDNELFRQEVLDKDGNNISVDVGTPVRRGKAVAA
jgi:hypothetical protein